jgi:hypothetical protein
VEFVDEIDLDELLSQASPVDIYRAPVSIASRTWEVVVVPLESSYGSASIAFEIFGGVMIFLVALAFALIWMFNNMVRANKISAMEAEAQAERAIVESLFPSNVRNRLIKDAERKNKFPI